MSSTPRARVIRFAERWRLDWRSVPGLEMPWAGRWLRHRWRRPGRARSHRFLMRLRFRIFWAGSYGMARNGARSAGVRDWAEGEGFEPSRRFTAYTISN